MVIAGCIMVFTWMKTRENGIRTKSNVENVNREIQLVDVKGVNKPILNDDVDVVGNEIEDSDGMYDNNVINVKHTTINGEENSVDRMYSKHTVEGPHQDNDMTPYI